MKNEFLNELKNIAMESVGAEVTVDPYAGSEVAEELITLDIIDANTMAMESYEEALFAEAFEAQEIALESAELTFADIAKFNGELSMESVANAVKRGAYGAKIQVKKIIQKIVKFVVSIFDYFTTADGKFKSYNKLLKKYRDKLAKTNPAAEYKEGKEEKEISIKSWEGLDSALTAFATGVESMKLRELANALNSGSLSSVLKSLSSVKVNGNDLLPANVVTDGITDDEIKESLKELKENLKDQNKEANERLRDTKEVKFDEAKSTLMDLSAKLITGTAKDVKFKGDLAKIRKAANKFKDTADEQSYGILQNVNKVLVPCFTALKTTLTSDYKLIASGLQGVLADMAKVISAGTKVND